MPILLNLREDLSSENIAIIEEVIAHKQIANVHNRRIVFFGGLSAHSNAVGIACEYLPTSNHRQADRTGIAAAYHRVRATHEAHLCLLFS